MRTCPETPTPAGTSPAGVVGDRIVSSTSTADSTRPHIHLRGSYCPAALVAPFEPRKAAAKYLFEYADALLFEETFRAFVERHPDDFPGITSAAPVDAEIVTVVR